MTAPAPQRVYAGMTADARRAERRSRLIGAAIDVLARRGWEGATVTAVCEQAHLIPRYFYESFEDRDGLLLAVFDDILAEVTAEAAPGLNPDAPVEDGAAAAIGAWMRVSTRDPARGRVAFVEALGSGVLMARRLDATRAFADALFGQVANSYRVTAKNRPALLMASLVVAGGLIETMIEWLRGRVDASPDEVVEHFTAVARAAFDAAAG